MSTSEKKNVNQFNQDVLANEGYLYTTNAKFSSMVANLRLTEATLDKLHSGIKMVIDVGAGDGTYTAEIKKAKPEISFWGLDPAAGAIETAQRKYPDIKFVVGNILEKETLPQQKFDLAVVRGVLHHLSNPKLALANVARLADHAIIIEPNGWNPVLKLIERLSTYHREHEEQSFSLSKLKTWCQEAGYRVTSVDYVGFVPFFFPTLLAKTIYAIQPLLEKIPVIKHLFTACYVIRCEKK